MQEDSPDSFLPHWTTIKMTSASNVQIVYQLWDEDSSGFTGSDDQFDITPADNRGISLLSLFAFANLSPS